MYDYTGWIVFYDLFALSENDEIKMINHNRTTDGPASDGLDITRFSQR